MLIDELADKKFLRGMSKLWAIQVRACEREAGEDEGRERGGEEGGAINSSQSSIQF